MIKIVRDTRVPTKAVELDNFDLKSFYRLFLDGYDCPYYYNSYDPESLIFDTSGIHPSRGNECSLFDGLELALATNKLGEPSDILQIQVWYKREKCFYFKFTPFK